MKGYPINPLDLKLGINWPIPVEALNNDLISRKDASAPTVIKHLAKQQYSPSGP